MDRGSAFPRAGDLPRVALRRLVRARCERAAERPIRRVLITFPYRLGDYLMLTPALAALTRDDPELRIDLLVPGGVARAVAELARGFPALRRVLDPGGAPLRAALGGGWDRVVHLGRAGAREHALALLGGAGRVEGGDRPLLSTAEEIPRTFFQAVVGRTPGADDSLRPVVMFDHAEHALRTRGAIVVALGGADHNRRYPHWPRVVARLSERLPRREVVVVAAAEDRPEADAAAAAPGARALISPGRLDHICGWIAGAALVVTTDTLYLHLAGAFERPRLALFGPTDPALRISDLDRPGVRALRRPELCERAPCHNDMFGRCRTGPVDCMAIPPDEVCDAVAELLRSVEGYEDRSSGASPEP